MASMVDLVASGAWMKDTQLGVRPDDAEILAKRARKREGTASPT
jgi:hypothetical protein